MRLDIIAMTSLQDVLSLAKAADAWLLESSGMACPRPPRYCMSCHCERTRAVVAVGCMHSDSLWGLLLYRLWLCFLYGVFISCVLQKSLPPLQRCGSAKPARLIGSSAFRRQIECCLFECSLRPPFPLHLLLTARDCIVFFSA